MHEQVDREYRVADTDAWRFEVDHLVPLELGGSNRLTNLWSQPYEPRPDAGEKDSLEKELHHLVGTGKMSLADAQTCIRSNWVTCWEQHVEWGYKPPLPQ
jgi:hypothetical protein